MKLQYLMLGVLGLAACSSDEELLSPSPIPTSDVSEVVVNIPEFNFGKSSRMDAEITTGGALHFNWAGTDTLGIFPETGSQVAFPLGTGNKSVTDAGAGTSQGTFTGGGWKLKGDSIYAAYYPYRYENRNLKKVPLSFLGQCQEGDNNMTHLGGHAFMYSQGVKPVESKIVFNMNHVGTAVKLTVTLPKVAYHTEWVAIRLQNSAETPVYPTGALNLSTQKFEADLDNPHNLNLRMKGIRSAANEESKTMTFWMMMPPADYSGKKLTFRLTDETYSEWDYTVDGKNMVAGGGVAYKLTTCKPATNICTQLGPVPTIQKEFLEAFNIASTTTIGELPRYVYEVNSKREPFTDGIISESGKLPGAYVIPADHQVIVYTSAEKFRLPISAKGLYASGADVGNKIDKLILSYVETSGTTDMSLMFKGAFNLKYIDLRSFDTKKVTKFASMFEGCSNLSKLVLGPRFRLSDKNMSNQAVTYTDLFKDAFTNVSTVNIKCTTATKDFLLGYYDKEQTLPILPSGKTYQFELWDGEPVTVTR